MHPSLPTSAPACTPDSLPVSGSCGAGGAQSAPESASLAAVELRSRLRIAELMAAIDREIDELRQQSALPYTRPAIAWLITAREGLDGAEQVLRMAERELKEKR